MDVLIKGMKMPTEGGIIVVYKISGKFFAARAGKDELFPIIPVSPHGRLIDADALKVSLAYAKETAKWSVPLLRTVLMIVDKMPTIIPASEEGEK